MDGSLELQASRRLRPLETVANRSDPMVCGPNVDQAGPLAEAAAPSRSGPRAGKVAPRRLPPTSEPRPATALLGRALAGSGPGTSPSIDGLSLVTSTVIPKRPSS